MRVYVKGNVIRSEEGTFEIMEDGRVIYYAKDRPRTIARWNPEEGEYFRRVYPDQHIHKRTNSFAFPYALIAHLYKKRGLKTLVVDVVGEGIYRLNIEKIVKEGKLDRSIVDVRRYNGFETQIFIPKRYFSRDDAYYSPQPYLF